MKKIIFVFILLMMIGLVGCGKDDENKMKNSDDFALTFLKIENKEKNIVYSPLSIKYALSMLNEGAQGETKEEIDDVIEDLKFPKYKSIDKNLSFANAIFIRDSYKENVKSDFNDSLKKKYDAEICYDKFENATNVNKFIEERTLGIIKNMLYDSAIQDPNLRLIIINALAIDMEWKESFSFNSTYGSDFIFSDGTKMQATTMHKSNSKSKSISFYKNDEIVSISMDLKKYDNVELEFMAIMPKTSLSEYVKNFKVENIDEIREKSKLASETKSGIDISIPKFKYDYDLELKNDLSKLGINRVFAQDADLSNIADDPYGLYVSDALHKADIEFSEEGVKAAAVTAIMVAGNSMPVQEEKEEIIIDKPFLYVIRDKANDEIWFVGTVYNPNSWENDMEKYR